MTVDSSIGDCVLTSLYGPDGVQTGIRVEQADPRVLMSGELAERAVWNNGARPWLVHSHAPSGESLLTINGVNRKVIYRVVEYLPAEHAYLLEWPD